MGSDVMHGLGDHLVYGLVLWAWGSSGMWSGVMGLGIIWYVVWCYGLWDHLVLWAWGSSGIWSGVRAWGSSGLWSGVMG